MAQENHRNTGAEEKPKLDFASCCEGMAGAMEDCGPAMDRMMSACGSMAERMRSFCGEESPRTEPAGEGPDSAAE